LELAEMLAAVYDILRRDGLDLVWIEAAYNFEAAKSRIDELRRQSRGEYVVFDQRKRQMIAEVDSSTSGSQVLSND
jgi:hypothetical protein